MAGVKEIEEVIHGIHGILDIANREGRGAWTFDGTTLVIKSRPLATKIQQVLAGVDKAKLAEESGDLSPFEMVKLYRLANDIPNKILGR